MLTKSRDPVAETKTVEPEKNSGNSGPKMDTDASPSKHNLDPSLDEYPGGIRLICVVLALALTIFLGSLDMVLFSQTHGMA